MYDFFYVFMIYLTTNTGIMAQLK